MKKLNPKKARVVFDALVTRQFKGENIKDELIALHGNIDHDHESGWIIAEDIELNLKYRCN